MVMKCLTHCLLLTAVLQISALPLSLNLLKLMLSWDLCWRSGYFCTSCLMKAHFLPCLSGRFLLLPQKKNWSLLNAPKLHARTVKYPSFLSCQTLLYWDSCMTTNGEVVFVAVISTVLAERRSEVAQTLTPLFLNTTICLYHVLIDSPLTFTLEPPPNNIASKQLIQLFLSCCTPFQGCYCHPRRQGHKCRSFLSLSLFYSFWGSF